MPSIAHPDREDSLTDQNSSIDERHPLLPRHAGESDEHESHHSRDKIASLIRKRAAPWISTARRILPKGRLKWPQIIRAFDRANARHRLFAQVIFLVAWLLVDSFLVRQSWCLSSLSEPSQFPEPTRPEWLHCVQAFWLKDDGCGLNGQECRQYRNVSLPFRCPAHCGTSTGLLNPRVVGGQVANYQPLVVGGGGPEKRYRPDSFICQSAIHAGIISARWGGCGVLKMLDGTGEFVGTEAHGIHSLGVPAPFPTSFIFLDSVTSSGCHDLWLPIVWLNILFSSVFTLALQPSPQMLFWVLSVVGYWIVVVASEPSSLPPSWSKSTGIFLPFLFVCNWLWTVSWSNTLQSISHLDRMWVYLGPWWLGVLMNLTIGWVPIDKLTPHDLQQRPGALLTFIILLALTILLICYQAWCLRKENRLGPLQLPYACLGMVLVLLLFVPEHSVRIHHYLIGIFLSPLASARTRLSGVLQGFLLGMVQNGIARWSFASVLERSSDVFGDGYHAADRMPVLDFGNSGIVKGLQDLTISWTDEGCTEHALMGVMINDLLRFIVPSIRHSLTIHNFITNLTSFDTAATILSPIPVVNSTLDAIYFRLAFFENGLSGEQQRVGEYTGPVTFFMNNHTWSGPIPVV